MKMTIEILKNVGEAPLGLLLSADPSVALIEEYLQNGTCFIAKTAAETVGAIVLCEIEPAVVEIKNIAVKIGFQNKGIGKMLLKHAEAVCRRENCKKLMIATGNSSIGQLALYQKAGFELTKIDKDFFTKNYKEPIFENGIQCKHRLVLEKSLIK